MKSLTDIPVVPESEHDSSPACGGGEPFALMVLGDSMIPEFEDGDVVVIEPEGLAADGSFVVAVLDDEPIMRQLMRRESSWMLQAMNARYPSIPIEDLSVVKGVVMQKVRPGRRRLTRRYFE